MRAVFLDTSEIERGLERLAGPGDRKNSDANGSAITLCKHLIFSDRICFDGLVHKPIRDRIEGLISKLGESLGSKSGEEFAGRFFAVAPADRAERLMVRTSIRAAADWFRATEMDTAGLSRYLPAGKETLTDPDSNLFAHLRKRNPPDQAYLDALLQRKNILGRRFYWAILSDEVAFESLARDLAEYQRNPALLPILFTRFRILLATKRAEHSAKQVSEKERIYYHPAKLRRQFLTELSLEIRKKDPWIDALEPALTQIWRDDISDAIYSEQTVPVPVMLDLLLAQSVATTPAIFLRDSLNFSRYPVVKKVRKACDYYATLETALERQRLIKDISDMAASTSPSALRKNEAKAIFFTKVPKGWHNPAGPAIDLVQHFMRWRKLDRSCAVFTALVPSNMLADQKSRGRLNEIFGTLPLNLGF